MADDHRYMVFILVLVGLFAIVSLNMNGITGSNAQKSKIFGTPNAKAFE